MTNFKHLKEGDYLLVINRCSNIWNLFIIKEYIKKLGLEAMLIESSSEFLENLIGKLVYLSANYFVSSNEYDIKKFIHKPNDAEILAMIL